MKSLIHPGKSMIVHDPNTSNPYATHGYNEKVDIENRSSVLEKLGVDEKEYGKQFEDVFNNFAKKINQERKDWYVNIGRLRMKKGLFAIEDESGIGSCDRATEVLVSIGEPKLKPKAKKGK